jgi:hypothetical protein
MIYNLVNYLLTQLPTIEFVANGFNKQSPDEAMLVQQTGGDHNHRDIRKDYTIQFLCRSRDSVDGKGIAEQVYAEMQNKFRVLLPEVIIATVTYPEVQTAQISPIQLPAYIGTDEEGRHMWSFNMVVTTGG